MAREQKTGFLIFFAVLALTLAFGGWYEINKKELHEWWDWKFNSSELVTRYLV